MFEDDCAVRYTVLKNMTLNKTTPVACLESMHLLNKTDTAHVFDFFGKLDHKIMPMLWHSIDGSVDVAFMADAMKIMPNGDLWAYEELPHMIDAQMLVCGILTPYDQTPITSIICINPNAKSSELAIYDPTFRMAEKHLTKTARHIKTWLVRVLGNGWRLRTEVYGVAQLPSEITDGKKRNFWLTLLFFVKSHMPNHQFSDIQSDLYMHSLTTHTDFNTVLATIAANIFHACNKNMTHKL